MKKFISLRVITYMALLLLAPAISFAKEESPEIKGLEQMAKKNDKEAQLNIAKIYINGKETPVDYKKAEKWLKKASENGVSEADYLLGVLYFEGKLGKPDDKKGLKYLVAASEAGNAESQYYLGTLYEEGKLGTPNMNNALSFYEKGAEGGSLRAQKYLAKLYEKGDKVQADKAKSIRMKEMASAQGDTEYLVELGNYYLSLDKDKQNREKALQYLLAADKAGDKNVQHTIGHLYLTDESVRNEAEAIPMLLKSAAQGNYADYYESGKIFLTGRGNVSPDYSKAFEYLKEAYYHDYTDAAPLLGLLYFYGIGTTDDTSMAVLLFNKNPNDGVSAYSYMLCQDLNISGAKTKIISDLEYRELGYLINQNKFTGTDLNVLKNITKRMADTGNTYAEYSMGNLLRFNIGLDEDEEATALHLCSFWYGKAAEKQLPQAQDFLGECYCDGIGVNRNLEEGVTYFRQAADQGYARAQCDLATVYAMELDGVGNMAEAIRLLRASADQDYTIAQCNLGICYESGNGVTQNNSTAVKYYMAAAEQGCSLADFLLGRCFFTGIGLEENYDQAVKYLKKATDKGYAPAFIGLGQCYMEGLGVEKSTTEGLEYYKKAADLGDSQAYIVLGNLYYSGEEVPKNYEEAVKYYNMAASMGNPQGMNNLAECYEDGDGVSQDMKEAKRLYQQAAEMGNENAINSLERLSRAPLNIKNFAQVMDSPNGYRSLSACKSTITNAMSKLGFSFEYETEELVEEEDPYDEDETVTYEVIWLFYTDGRTIISFGIIGFQSSYFEVNRANIEYSSESQADKFISASKSALGSKLETYGDGYSYNTRGNMYYGLYFEQDENEIGIRLYYDD